MIHEMELLGMHPLSDWLLKEVAKRHTTLRQFAKDAGVSREVIRRLSVLDTTPTGNFTIDSLAILANYTDVDIRLLVGWIAPDAIVHNERVDAIFDEMANAAAARQYVAEEGVLKIVAKAKKK